MTQFSHLIDLYVCKCLENKCCTRIERVARDSVCPATDLYVTRPAEEEEEEEEEE